MALRISNNGNIIETMTGALGSKWHRVVFDTAGLGDRRQRKSAARARLAELCPPPPESPYTIYVYGHAAGNIRSINIRFTLTV